MSIQNLHKTLFVPIVVVVGLALFGAACTTSAPTAAPVSPASSSIPGSAPGPAPTVTGDRPTVSNVIAELDLSGQAITKFPMYLLDHPELEKLNLSHNKMNGALPAEIRKLANLKELNISYNQFTGLPAELGQLSNLEYLDVSYNQLTGLPYELGNLTKLKRLNLSGNSYSEQDLQVILSHLPNLEVVK